MNYLTQRDIKLINKEMTLKFGGLFVSSTNNVRNEKLFGLCGRGCERVLL